MMSSFGPDNVWFLLDTAITTVELSLGATLFGGAFSTSVRNTSATASISRLYAG